MSDWEEEFDNAPQDAPEDDLWGAGGDDAFVGGDDGFGLGEAHVEDWEMEVVTLKKEAPKVKAAPQKSHKQLVKEQEQAEREKERRLKQEADAERERMKDPKYAQAKRDAEKQQMEQAEASLIDDLFGEGFTQSLQERAENGTDYEPIEKTDEELAIEQRARELAEMTGLVDGKDGAQANNPDARTEAQAPPTDLDAFPLKNIDDAKSLSKILVRKIRDSGEKETPNILVTLISEMVRDLTQYVKLENLNEIIRVTTVQANTLQKKQQNKKKVSKKPQLNLSKKASTHDDDDDDRYDDYDDFY